MLLKVEELIKVFPGPVPALRGISLEIDNGLFGLLGPNGAGKSTFMNIITGGMMPTSGKVTLGGQDIIKDPSRVRGTLGFLPQQFGFYPRMSGRAMLELILSFKGVSSRRERRLASSELLEAVNLTDVAKRRIREYSGGMRQRLGIAQAIAGNPGLIVLDEPTAGLDPGERSRLYDILLSLAENRTIILSTHIVEDVATVCDRFAVIGHGRCLHASSCSDARKSLEGRTYELISGREDEQPLPEGAVVTERTVIEGSLTRWRFISNTDTWENARPVSPTLADAYFNALSTEKTQP